MFKFLLSLFLLMPSVGLADGIVGKPDSHSPIGVMGDHTHKKGELMFSYRYMRMEMSDLQDASHDISRNDAVSSTGSYKFMNAPIKMHTNMHMFGGMYGINNRLTGMVMFPFINKKMQVRQRAGDKKRFTISTRGLGDVKLTGLYTLKKNINSSWLLNFGISIPTGETNAKDVMVMMNGSHTHSTLGYGMQLGSGTYDPILKIGYRKKWNKISLGWQTSGIWRLYQNSDNYHIGDEYKGTLYSAFVLNDWISFSGRVDGKWVRKISGAHAHHSNMLMSPVFSKDQGHRKVNISGGINFIIPRGELKGQRLALEYNNPIYQYYDGLQMKSDKTVTLGWQYAFTFKDLF
ncbi:MAG: transporter [Alphaproteobacteria bacterium]|nr:transporter [Alphaproteobacteria bacterium]